MVSVPMQMVLCESQLLVTFCAGFLESDLFKNSQICSRSLAQEAVLVMGLVTGKQCCQAFAGEVLVPEPQHEFSTADT